MKKEDYLNEVAKIKNDIKLINEQLQVLRENYISANKNFEIGDKVKITRESGRVTVGEIKEFGILQDKLVYVTALKPEKGSKVYISEPYSQIEKL